MTGEQVLWIATRVVLVMLGISMLLALARLVRGPSLPDRVIALDLIGIISVAVIAVFSIVSGQEIYLSVAIALALVAFLGTVTFALYVQKGGEP